MGALSEAREMNQVTGPHVITGTCSEGSGLKTYDDEASKSKGSNCILSTSEVK